MGKKAVTVLAAAAALAGSAVVGQGLLPGIVSTAQAQSASGWSFVGPEPLEPAHILTDRNWGNSSGRITSVAVVPDHPGVIYVGAAGGGVWKSEDSGKTWKPLTDNVSMAIGALAVSSTGETVWAGTGEINGSDSQYGQGLLKSTDGGKTWTVWGRGRSTFGEHFIGGVVANGSRVLVATDRGVYQSPNSGLFWRKIDELNTVIPPLREGEEVSGQVYEIHQDPTDPAKYWASFGDRCGTEAGGIATSDDRGTTWKVVYSNAGAGRMVLGVGPGGVAYAGVADCAGALLSIEKTKDGGSTWTPIPANTPGYTNYFKGNPEAQDQNAQGDYDNVVGVDPADSNRAVFGGITILATSDGGKKFTDIGRVYRQGFIHPDIHAIAFSGPSSFYVGEDGGLWHTSNMGGTGTKAKDWTNLNGAPGSKDQQGLRITQFNAGVSPSLTDLLGGTQDNGSPAALPNVAPKLPAMGDIASGDGGDTAIDPTPNSHTVYFEQPNLDIWRTTWPKGKHVETQIQPCPRPECNDPRGFYAPYVMDLSKPERLLAGTNRVYQTTNAKAAPGPVTWSAISGKLTLTDQGVLTSIALPPTGGDTIFTASNDGEVARTTDAKDWTDITGNLPQPDKATNPGGKPFFTQVTFNPANPSQAWVTIGQLGVGHLWYTSNAGAPTGTHWVDLSGTETTALPKAPALSVVEVPGHPGTIDVGTYYGVWTCSTCGGESPQASWERLGGTDLAKGALPKVEVDRLSVTSDDKTLVAWTHGRGIWKIGLGASSARPQTLGNGRSLTAGHPTKRTLPSNQPMIVVQFRNGRILAVTGTALLPGARRTPKTAVRGGQTARCDLNFTDSVKPLEGSTEVDRWFGGIGCNRKMFMFGTAYLQETATAIDAAGNRYQQVTSSAESGRKMTIVRKPPTPTLLYIRHLTNVYFPSARFSGKISIFPAPGQKANAASKCVVATLSGHGVGVHCDYYTNRFGLSPTVGLG